MATRLLRPTPTWRRRLVWILLLAVLTGAISVVFDQGDEGLRLTVILAVVGLLISLVLETRFRLEDLSKRLRIEAAAEAAKNATRAEQAATAMTEFTATLHQYAAFAQAPTSARAFLADVAIDWKRMEERGGVFLGWLRRDTERDFRSRLQSLANGRAVLDKKTQHSFRTIPMDGFARIQSLSATNPGYWRTPRGKQYLENQRIAIENGTLTVRRTLVFGRDELESSADVIQDQIAAGVDIAVIVRDEVDDDGDRNELLRDLTLVVDNAGVVGVMRPGSPAIGESFTTDEGEVADATRVFSDINPYIRRVGVVFPALGNA